MTKSKSDIIERLRELRQLLNRCPNLSTSVKAILKDADFELLDIMQFKWVEKRK